MTAPEGGKPRGKTPDLAGYSNIERLKKKGDPLNNGKRDKEDGEKLSRGGS